MMFNTHFMQFSNPIAGFVHPITGVVSNPSAAMPGYVPMPPSRPSNVGSSFPSIQGDIVNGQPLHLLVG